MILQALYRYYEVLTEREPSSMPQDGYSSADVSFEIHIDEGGSLSAVIAYTDVKGRILRQSHIVPKQDKRTSGIKPYFLCDKAEYLFGSGLSMREACRQALKDLWTDILSNADAETAEIRALRSFLALSPERLADQLSTLTDEALRTSLVGGGLCVLKYAPSGRFRHKDQHVLRAWDKHLKNTGNIVLADDSSMTCLITGESTPQSHIARLHPNIKNVVGAQSAGAAIVSFNIESFRSYGRDQSYNAPTSQRAADAYGYALNKLLSDPKHKVRMNDTTVVFWVESASTKEQDWLASLFNDFAEDSSGGQPDEDSVRSRVQSAVLRIRQGQKFSDTFHDLDENTTFYILGLSPNAARLSIRFWYTGNLGEIGSNVWKHYEDLSIVGLDRSPTIRELLREIAVGHDWSRIPPNMEGQMFRSILMGMPYSRAIFAQLVNRIRSDSDEPRVGLFKIGAVRAAMLKAYLRRYFRSHNDAFEGEMTMSLNEESTSVPYHLGRLFACLEKTQESALGQGINATIRDRFWGAASATPANVFPRLLNLAQHHIAKDEEWGRVNDQRIQAVMNALPPQFPRRLTLEDQGVFALGYYHQRQDFYTKKADKESKTNEERAHR